MDADSSPCHYQSDITRLKQLFYPYIVPPFLLLCLLGILANGIILLSVRWLHQTPSPLLMLTISLCAANVWFAVQQSLNFVLEGYLPHVYGITINQTPCRALMMEAVRCGALITTMLHLFTLVHNYYVSMIFPLQYKKKMTPKLTYTIIFTIWLLPAGALIIFFYLKSNNGFDRSDCGLIDFYFTFSFRLAIGLIYAIPLVRMLVICVRIGVLSTKRHQSPHLLAQTPADELRRNLRSATTTMTLHSATFVVCYMPNILMFVLMCNGGCPINLHLFLMREPLMLLVVSGVFQASLITKAIFDAAIIVVRVPEIQFAIRCMFTCFSCEQRSPSSSLTHPSTTTRQPASVVRL